MARFFFVFLIFEFGRVRRSEGAIRCNLLAYSATLHSIKGFPLRNSDRELAKQSLTQIRV